MTKFDKDGDGLEQGQFYRLVRKGGGNINDTEQAFERLDNDGNGIVTKQ